MGRSPRLARTRACGRPDSPVKSQEQGWEDGQLTAMEMSPGPTESSMQGSRDQAPYLDWKIIEEQCSKDYPGLPGGPVVGAPTFSGGLGVRSLAGDFRIPALRPKTKTQKRNIIVFQTPVRNLKVCR